MKTKHFLPALIAVLASASPSVDAAITVGSTSFTYSQTFDTLITSGTTQAWSNDSTLAGWSLFTKDNNAITTYNAGAGASNAGAFYSFGTGTDTDRALGGAASGGTYFGSPATGAVAGYIALGLTNDTGGTLPGITIGFSGEQWRNGGNTTAQTMVFEYGIGATFATVSSWTAPGGNFNWTSPVATASAAAVDGNVAGLVSGKGGTISGLTWEDGDTLWFRWVEVNDSGNDHGLAIDNFSITAVPEPAAALLGSLGFLAILRRRR